MKNDIFDKHIEAQLQRCYDDLVTRSTYGPKDDRLHDFVAYANLAGLSLEQACGGYLGKCLVNLYSMIKASNKEATYSPEQWTVKINEAIDYLLILSVIVQQEKDDGKANSKIYISPTDMLRDQNAAIASASVSMAELSKTIAESKNADYGG